MKMHNNDKIHFINEDNERVKLSKKQREYYRIISESIMNDQVDDNRDGIDTFITYKKDEKA